MERTPDGTPVGVDDPYDVAGKCDHLTSDGRCRFALERAGHDPAFAEARRADDYECLVSEEGAEWRDCPHYRSTTRDHECRRCGLEEVRLAGEDARPLLEQHHLSYPDGAGTSHEITVTLCRWCHSKVHNSIARIDDDAGPDPEAVAARETRRAREQAEFGFESAADRYDGVGESGSGSEPDGR